MCHRLNTTVYAIKKERKKEKRWKKGKFTDTWIAIYSFLLKNETSLIVLSRFPDENLMLSKVEISVFRDKYKQ